MPQATSENEVLWRRSRQVWVLCSLAVCGAIVLLNRSPSGDLARWYTDALHHAFATWVFLHKGLAIYTQPFSQVWPGVSFAHPMPSWPFMPGMVYPPGVLAVFFPFALIAQLIPLSREAYAKVCVLGMVFLAHAACYAVLLSLQATRRAGEFTVGLLAWLTLARLGVMGFYDSAWIGCGALMIYFLAQKRPEWVLRCFGAAALLHFRAVVLVPLAAAALWQLLSFKPWRQWPWKELAWVGLCCVLCLSSFALMYPVTHSYRESQVSLMQQHEGLRFWTVVVISLLAIGLSAWLADEVVAATVTVASVLALIYVPFWWHGAVALIPLLAVGAFKAGRAPAAARTALVGWLLCVQALAWNDSPTALFVEFVRYFRMS